MDSFPIKVQLNSNLLPIYAGFNYDGFKLFPGYILNGLVTSRIFDAKNTQSISTKFRQWSFKLTPNQKILNFFRL